MLEINRKVGEVIVGCLLIGSHSVSSALLAHKSSEAIRSALTLAVCVLILALAARVANVLKQHNPSPDRTDKG